MTSMADLDLDELERMRLAVQSQTVPAAAVLEYVAILDLAAPALIAAARERDRLRAENARLCALAYIGEHYFEDSTYKSQLDEIVPQFRALEAERDRLRAAVDGVLADVARWREHTEGRESGGQHVGTGGEIGNLSHSTAAYLERALRAAGGGT